MCFLLKWKAHGSCYRCDQEIRAPLRDNYTITVRRPWIGCVSVLPRHKIVVVIIIIIIIINTQPLSKIPGYATEPTQWCGLMPETQTRVPTRVAVLWLACIIISWPILPDSTHHLTGAQTSRQRQKMSTNAIPQFWKLQQKWSWLQSTLHDTDQSENLTTSSLVQGLTLHIVWFKSVDNFFLDILCTDSQTHADDRNTFPASLAAVTTLGND